MNQETFYKAIDIERNETPDIARSDIPIIHISAHGNQDGIQLTDGAFLAWAELRKTLARINDELRSLLILCMSSCEGFGAARMAFNLEPLPFFALIGPTEKISLTDTAIAFLILYYRLYKGAGPAEVMAAMKISSGNDSFEMVLGHNAQNIWKEFVTSNY